MRPSPRRLRLEVRPDHRVHDPRTGLAVTGAWSRAAILLANMDLGGYDMLRDEAALARSDATLLAFSR